MQTKSTSVDHQTISPSLFDAFSLSYPASFRRHSHKQKMKTIMNSRVAILATTMLLITAQSSAFVANTIKPSRVMSFRKPNNKFGFRMSTELRYSNYTQAAPSLISPLLHRGRRRDKLKKELAKASIEKYDIDAYNSGMTTIAEDLMKKLEPLRPWSRPAHRSELNARWSFVFTGVPTVGMKLITLLSRISVGFPAIDFRDVFLEVSNKQSMVKAIVSCHFFGVPLELNVFTSLRPDNTCPHGTMMIEKFEGIKLAGFDIPTPESWHSARTLEISYLDQDMMIARTAGGEPHFLLRHSPCSTDDESCDIDGELTAFFQEARAKYGQKIARCLVDRAYGDEQTKEGATGIFPTVDLSKLDPGLMFGLVSNHRRRMQKNERPI